MSDLLEHALKYASYGWNIFPCNLDKSPMTITGFKEATTDTDKIKKWWTRNPNASIGCACGPDSGIWVVDIDLPNGPDSWATLLLENENINDTLEQQTGSGGRQLFFNYNGTDIRNSASKIGDEIDIRGNGGYIILPPSNHPSGNQYQWITKTKPTNAPNWLSGLVKHQEPILTITETDRTSLYAKKALANEIINVSSSRSGSRNDTLNKAAYSLGQLISGGVLDESTAFNGLFGAAIASGLKQKEAKSTIKSGFKSGFSKPRKPEKDIEYTIPDSNTNQQNQQNQQAGQKSATISNNQQNQPESAIISNAQQESATEKQTQTTSKPYNLTALITEYVKNSSGSFTTRDVDHEFGLSTRKEKNARSQALCTCLYKKLIKKDTTTNGKYHIIKSVVEWIDLDAPAEESFDVVLPFDIHTRVIIPPHAIILLAGSSNAGKTSFILNTLWMNRKKEYKKINLMSEMGTGEYISRIKKFAPDWKEQWNNIKATSVSYDFDDIIANQNPDGLTCIDYLEEKDGEYFKITSSIRSIYDSIGDGVAMVAIQKTSKGDIGRGGEGTLEKSRLYMTLDYLATGERSIICALKLVKVKNFIGVNLQNHEIHFRLSEGHRIDALTDWILSSKVDRDAYKRKYESQIDDLPDKINPGDIFIRLTNGDVRRITEPDARKWQKEFYTVDVFAELNRISKGKPFLTKENYFFSLSGMIKKQHKNNIKTGG